MFFFCCATSPIQRTPVAFPWWSETASQLENATAVSTSPSLCTAANNHRPQIPPNTAAFLTNGATTPKTQGDGDRVAERSGFEPRLPDPEPGVPPLNYCPS